MTTLTGCIITTQSKYVNVSPIFINSSKQMRTIGITYIHATCMHDTRQQQHNGQVK